MVREEALPVEEVEKAHLEVHLDHLAGCRIARRFPIGPLGSFASSVSNGESTGQTNASFPKPKLETLNLRMRTRSPLVLRMTLTSTYFKQEVR